jgi:hypothetical protein
MGPRTGLDAMEKRRIFCPCQESRPGSSVFQPVAQSLWRRANPAWYVGNSSSYLTTLSVSETIVDIGFEVSTAVVMKTSVVWDITPSSPVRLNRRFGWICHHLQGQRISQARNQHEAGSNATCSSVKSVGFHRTTLLCISEERTLFSVDRWMIVNNEQERMLKESVVVQFKALYRNLPETLRKITLHRIGVPLAEIRTGYLPNTSHKYYCLSQLAALCVCVFTKCIRFPVYHSETSCNLNQLFFTSTKLTFYRDLN